MNCTWTKRSGSIVVSHSSLPHLPDTYFFGPFMTDRSLPRSQQQPQLRPELPQPVTEHLNYSIQRYADPGTNLPATHPDASLRPPPGFSSPTPTAAEAVARAQAIITAVDAAFQTQNGST